jgi:hypothetical protein
MKQGEEVHAVRQVCASMFIVTYSVLHFFKKKCSRIFLKATLVSLRRAILRLIGAISVAGFDFRDGWGIKCSGNNVLT